MATQMEIAASPRCQKASNEAPRGMALRRSSRSAKIDDEMAIDQQKLIEQIHASGKQFVVAITGGGSGAISALLEVPGGSASVLEAVVPYSASETSGSRGS